MSVEVALKMALQYQRGLGRPERTRMLTVRGGYHGDTFDCDERLRPRRRHARDVAGRSSRSRCSGHGPRASTPTRPTSTPGRLRCARSRPSTPHELAGIIVEPLLQGAGGMHPYPPECLAVFREIADEHGLLLIFDEIATGFGRTGHLFASELAGVTPDILCLGKALTGGYLTLAAVLTTDDVARGICARASPAC